MPFVSRPTPAPEFGVPGGTWLNGPPRTLAQERGHVVLLDFFDYSCVNCLRTLPYLTEWRRRYATTGFVLLGIHAPEFGFGREADRVRSELARLGIDWPVLLDPDFTVWRRYTNRFWPAKYLIDGAGQLRYYQFGEGEYRETEEAIQLLLWEQHPEAAFPDPVPPLRPTDRPGAVCYPVTAELYLGGARGRWPYGAEERGEARTFLPVTAAEGVPVLEGSWAIRPEFVEYVGDGGADGRLILRYSAKEVNVVMAPGTTGAPPVEIRLDGRPVPDGEQGRDLEGSRVRLDAARMYSLVEHRTVGAHRLELLVGDRGWRGYAFTFGTCEVDGP